MFFPAHLFSFRSEFFCLRNYAWLNGKAVTEQVYVHSKLLIADDRLVIMGSANLNDRSLYGDRDSEIAAIITGGDKVITRLGGMPWRSTVFAHTLRRNLMEEHTGLSHTVSVLIVPVLISSSCIWTCACEDHCTLPAFFFAAHACSATTSPSQAEARAPAPGRLCFPTQCHSRRPWAGRRHAWTTPT